MVIHCPACKSRMVLANSGAILQEWECSHCHSRFKFADGRFLSCGSWIISENSGELRAVCPYCRQHYAAASPEQPKPVRCVYCGETFLLPPHVHSVRPGKAFRFLPKCGWTVSENSGELRAVCPYCRQHYAAPPETDPSKSVKCVYCGEMFLVAPPRRVFPFDLPPGVKRSGRSKSLREWLSNLRGRRMAMTGAAIGVLLAVVLVAVLILSMMGKDRAVPPAAQEDSVLSDNGK